jgi:hypothetical protein
MKICTNPLQLPGNNKLIEQSKKNSIQLYLSLPIFIRQSDKLDGFTKTERCKILDHESHQFIKVSTVTSFVSA